MRFVFCRPSMVARWPFGLVIRGLPLMLLLLGTLASPARAGDVRVSRGEIVFTGAAGTATGLSVAYEEAPHAVRFADVTAPVTAGEGCVDAGAGAAICALGAREHVRIIGSSAADRIDVDLQVPLNEILAVVIAGNGDDEVRVLANATVYGGRGADTLRGADADFHGLRLIGGAGEDRLLGGRGADWLVGDGVDRPGGPSVAPADDVLAGGSQPSGEPDRADYEARTAALRFDLAKGFGGQDGERDRLRGIESLSGGRGDDTLRGSARDESLSGSGGRDTLDGRDGDDNLDGHAGADLVIGGPGDDRLNSYGRPAEDILRGGPGDDSLGDPARGSTCGEGRDEVVRSGALPRRTLDASCELWRLWVPPRSLATVIPARGVVRRGDVVEIPDPELDSLAAERWTLHARWSGRRPVIGRLTRRAGARGPMRIRLDAVGRRYWRRGGRQAMITVATTVEGGCTDNGCASEPLRSPLLPLLMSRRP